MELLFDIDNAGVLIGKQFPAHPLEFTAREAGLGNVDGGASEVGTDDVAFSVGGVAVDTHQAHLIVNGANGGADYERLMKLSTVRTCKTGLENRRSRGGNSGGLLAAPD